MVLPYGEVCDYFSEMTSVLENVSSNHIDLRHALLENLQTEMAQVFNQYEAFLNIFNPLLNLI